MGQNVKQVHISELEQDRANANKGSERGTYMLESSFREFGAGRSILIDKFGRIIAGNKSAEQAAAIGLDDVIVIESDGTKLIAVQRTDLDLYEDERARKLAYADNRTSDFMTWNPEQVLGDITAGLDLSGMFRQDELDELLADLTPKPTGDTEPQVDRAEELRQLWNVQPGQLWQLGEHRLICGDCTDAGVVARVMDGERAELLFTSPPYAQQRDYTAEATEVLSDWDALMQGAIGAALCSDDAQILVNLGLVHRDGEWLPYWDKWIEWMRAQGWRRFGWYVWDQTYGLPGDWQGRLAPSHEFVFHFNRVPVKPTKTTPTKHAGEINQNTNSMKGAGGKGFTHAGRAIQDFRIRDSVIRACRQQGGIDGHPAPFSVAFANEVIACWPGDVYEPFSGSGTTIIACENLGRKCRAVEISPAYVAVAIQRWADHCGGQPVLLD